jgi:hypothetical protein
MIDLLTVQPPSIKAAASARADRERRIGVRQAPKNGLRLVFVRSALTAATPGNSESRPFSGIRQFILDETAFVDSANAFIGKREHALIGEMLSPGERPDGWRAHVLCAETRPGECIAYVQTFLSEDWPAPIYAVRLAQDAAIIDCRATGHA